MSFSFQLDEGIKAGFKRIVTEEIRSTIEELGDDSIKRSEKVHRARRHGKQLRSLLRLASAGLGGQFKAQDRWIRDSSRQLSTLRDAKTVLDAYCKLLHIDKINAEQLSGDDALSELERQRRAQLSNKKSIDRSLTAVRERYELLLTQANKWSLLGKGIKIIEQGLFETYRDSRRTMQVAARDCDFAKRDEGSINCTGFHEWRKHVKYHLHHCRLIAPVWPKLLTARSDELDELGDFLGEENDLAVLMERIAEIGNSLGPQAIQPSLKAAITRRQELQVSSLASGRRLFDEKPHAFAKRQIAYWKIWRN
jgi:CHAD domain-containing protein